MGNVLAPKLRDCEDALQKAEKRIAELEAENKLLRQMVIDAYKEGYADANECGLDDEMFEPDWLNSDTFNYLQVMKILDKLNPQQKEPN